MQIHPEEKQEKLMAYIYGELSLQETMVFKQELASDSDLARELKAYLQLRHLVHEHLPHQKVPPGLAGKVLKELGLKKPWYTLFTEGFWRPALVGACSIALIVGIGSRIWQGQEVKAPTIATQQTPAAEALFPTENNPLLVYNDFSPQLRMASPQPSPAWTGFGRPQLVSYGNTTSINPQIGVLPEAQLYNLEMEAQHSVAQFMHQQALRLRAVGDYHSAAEQLAYLVKTYPFYPSKLQAMAQRVDLLFRDGEIDLAQQELKVLHELSPKLAYSIQLQWQ